MSYKSLKDTKLKITPTCFGSYVIHHQGVQSCAWLKLLVVIHRYFVVCLVGVWQRNLEPVVCMCVCVCVCLYGTAGNYYFPADHTVGVIFNFVSFKLLYNIDFNP
jgi:hypothetical protein